MTEIRPLDIEAVLLVDEIVHGLAQRWAHTPAEALAHLDSETHGLTWRLVEAHYGGPIPTSVRAAVRDLIDSHDPFFEAVRTANEHGPSGSGDPRVPQGQETAASLGESAVRPPSAIPSGPRCLRKGWTRDPRACSSPYLGDQQMSIDITGLDKAAVLAALHNGTGRNITADEARPFITAGDDHQRMFGDGAGIDQPIIGRRKDELYFDYFKGRPIKADITGDSLDERLYDRDAGPGAAARAIDAIRESARGAA